MQIGCTVLNNSLLGGFHVFLDHLERYNASQYIADEGGGYEQKGDEQALERRDSSEQHAGIEHRHDHHQGLGQVPDLMEHVFAQLLRLLLVALVSHHGLHERSGHTRHEHRIDGQEDADGQHEHGAASYHDAAHEHSRADGPQHPAP